MVQRILKKFKKKNKAFTLKGKFNSLLVETDTSIDSSVIINTSHGGTVAISKNCKIMESVILATYGGRISIGNNCSINPFCVIYGHGGLDIGNNVSIATHTVIVPANHKYENPDIPIRNQGLTKKGISIKDDVWIGASVKILDGVTIGSRVIVAAGAVVVNDLEGNAIYGGTPAKKIKNI